VLGRRRAALEETAALAGADLVSPEPCDVTDADVVARVSDRLLADWHGIVDAVVCAAGTNVAVRGLDRLTTRDIGDLIATNLVGAFHVAHAFLPAMRRRGRGTVVTIASDAGLLASAKAGAGYVASKFGLVGMTDTINAELRGEGIRACVICPGDIDTPLLDHRPVPPDAAARAVMLQPDDVVECVMLAITLPDRAIVERLVVRPR
jgi:NAD(P)-dependent dehydrogenase (short-subunit alcohol dehydrogenase family)